MIDPFAALVEEHLAPLYALAFRLTGGAADEAEDLLQDAMVRAWEHRTQLRDADSARHWFSTIVTRTYLNSRRAKKRSQETMRTDYDEAAFERALHEWSPIPTPESELEEAELKRRVWSGIRTLDDALREVLVLTDLEGFSQREVAGLLEVPVGTVASRLFRARRALSDIMVEAQTRGGAA